MSWLDRNKINELHHNARLNLRRYRPPEVLLKNPNQTTAVDIWASGVIMVSILSGCYPFFKASDDFDALAEITTVFGGEVVRKTAEKMSRHICMSRSNQPLHLRKLCVRLRRPPTSGGSVTSVDDKEMNMDFSADIFPDSAYDLMSKLFTVDPQKRISAAEALDHPFFKENM
ncbi:Cell division cycle 7-related protein kinase [Pseudolycoriella hygida]|uniref:Cell division cycle 7-related protein kinase n=1 Tax=Pseudolycoriella hygida TaxID=35572 RepID=A0A9Q0MRQ8_9DIPT|nr:Cell division cycle 7-related protein kinase [Pseudolycoriella hygida]